MHPSLLHLPGTPLSRAELISARLDGLLIEVGEGFMPPDLPENTAARLASLGPVILPGFAASGPSAAWVHGVGDAAPRCHHLQRFAPHRPRVRTMRDVIVHQSRLPDSDVLRIGALVVTTPVRTLTDLVLSGVRDPEALRWAQLLAARSPALVSEVRSALESRERIPGKRRALALVAQLESDEQAYEEVTR